MPTKTKTPATTVEPTTTFLPAVALNLITKHPNNPRHRASADQEMVDSIRSHGLLQPVVLAPHPTDLNKYVLIAGHRRLDGSRKAGRKTVPAILRTDLIDEGPQLEAMLIENGRRSDLTAIEEAEGYEQLGLFGYTQTAIATAVGRDVKTVRSRLKLLKLSSSTKKKVHAGQLRIEDAVAVVSFADDPDATQRLEKAANGTDFKVALKKEEKRRSVLQKCAAKIADLLAAGATEVDIKGQYPWDTNLPRNHMRLHKDVDWAGHDGCLGYVSYAGDYSNSYWVRDAEVVAVCTNRTGHLAEDDTVDEEARVAQEELAAAEAQRVAEQAARVTAGQVRVQSILDMVDGTQLPPAIHDLTRHLLPGVVRSLGGPELDIYLDALNVPEVDRWSAYHFNYMPGDRSRLKAETLFAEHASDIADASSTQMAKYLAALLAANAEYNLGRRSGTARDQESARDYLTLLDGIGHPFCELDKQLKAEVTNDTEVDQ